MVTTYLILFTFCLLIILSNFNVNEALKTSPRKLDECPLCQVYTDSFNNWLEKTSRGKFEGGDVAWEEAKLKSYARSEIRLVEIQEKLCSDLKKHKDECYSLAEKVEQLVENWWLENNPLDLYSWLCIDILNYCCPKDHFGPQCTPCPKHNNKSICNDNGICNGAGTRKGNGECKCNAGYSGQSCSECAKQYFLSGPFCKPCHKSCDECYNEGSDKCKICASGWKLENGICIDINECSDSNELCTSNQFCLNNEGSFKCMPCDIMCEKCVGSGPENCTECKPAYHLLSGKCINKRLAFRLTLNAFHRLYVYVPLFLLMFYVFLKVKPITIALITISIAMLVYNIENAYEITIIDVLINKWITINN